MLIKQWALLIYFLWFLRKLKHCTWGFQGKSAASLGITALVCIYTHHENAEEHAIVLERHKGYRDRSALRFAILFFLHIPLPECHRQDTRIKHYGLYEKAGHGNSLFDVHSCFLNTDWPCLPLPFSWCLFLEQLLHFSWPNSSPCFLAPPQFSLSGDFWKSSHAYPYSFAKHSLPESFYVSPYLLPPNITFWIMSELFQDLLLNSPLHCEFLDDTNIFPWLLVSPTITLYFGYRKYSINVCWLIDFLLSQLVLDLCAKCHPGFYEKEIKLWRPWCYRVYEGVANMEGFFFPRNK